MPILTPPSIKLVLNSNHSLLNRRTSYRGGYMMPWSFSQKFINSDDAKVKGKSYKQTRC